MNEWNIIENHQNDNFFSFSLYMSKFSLNGEYVKESYCGETNRA